jgi:hypothetical protein
LQSCESMMCQRFSQNLVTNNVLQNKFSTVPHWIQKHILLLTKVISSENTSLLASVYYYSSISLNIHDTTIAFRPYRRKIWSWAPLGSRRQDGLTDWPTLSDSLTDSLFDCRIDWLTDSLTHSLTHRPTDQPTDRLTGWLAGWLTQWLLKSDHENNGLRFKKTRGLLGCRTR